MDANILHSKIEEGLRHLEESCQEETTSFNYVQSHKAPESVSPNVETAYPKNDLDLRALRLVIRLRKPLSLLEFGSGWSTLAIAEELSDLDAKFTEFPFNTHRHVSTPFRAFTLDESKHWLNIALSRIPDEKKMYVSGQYSKVVKHAIGETQTLRYNWVPEIKPDLVYLDGPSQFALEIQSNSNEFSLNQPWFPPISSNLLQFEWLLEPGATILVDGRTTNVEFLVRNFQRTWRITRFLKLDMTLLTLISPPLGPSNIEKLNWEISAD